MSKGITQDCAMLWLHIAKSGGWWSVLRLTREWSPTYSLCEVEEHLVALHKGRFLAAQLHPQAPEGGGIIVGHDLPGRRRGAHAYLPLTRSLPAESCGRDSQHRSFR